MGLILSPPIIPENAGKTGLFQLRTNAEPQSQEVEHFLTGSQEPCALSRCRWGTGHEASAHDWQKAVMPLCWLTLAFSGGVFPGQEQGSVVPIQNRSPPDLDQRVLNGVFKPKSPGWGNHVFCFPF